MRGQTSGRGLRGQESHLSLQVFDPLLRVGREVSVIRQPNAAVGTGVHDWCLRHREGHCRGHWSVCGGHEAVGILCFFTSKSYLLSKGYVL